MAVPRFADAIFTRLDAVNLPDTNRLMFAAAAVGTGLLLENTYVTALHCTLLLCVEISSFAVSNLCQPHVVSSCRALVARLAVCAAAALVYAVWH